MPTFKVEYFVIAPAQTEDVEAEDSNQAIAKLVADKSSGGEVQVTRTTQLEETGEAPEPVAKSAPKASSRSHGSHHGS